MFVWCRSAVQGLPQWPEVHHHHLLTHWSCECFFFLIFQFLWHKHNAWNGYLFCYWMFYLACVNNNVGEIKNLVEESKMILLEDLYALSIFWLWEVCFMDFLNKNKKFGCVLWQQLIFWPSGSSTNAKFWFCLIRTQNGFFSWHFSGSILIIDCFKRRRKKHIILF